MSSVLCGGVRDNSATSATFDAELRAGGTETGLMLVKSGLARGAQRCHLWRCLTMPLRLMLGMLVRVFVI